MKVRPLTLDDYPGWDEFVVSHPYGSPFHLIAWKRTIEETFPYTPMYLLVCSGDRICGVLPLFLVRNILLGKALISTPFAVYGGILADSEEAQNALRDHLETYSRSLGVQHTELRNAYEQQCTGFARVSRYVTFDQRIGADEEELLTAIPRKTRYMVRKALKQPFTMRVASSPELFIDLYTANLRRLGTPSFPRKYFLSLLHHFGSGVDIREVLFNDKVVAAVMTFYFRDRILPYYGASDPQYNTYAPNNYMYFDLMRWGGQNGYTAFDFGRSKKESGSFDFKAHWGMEVRDLPYEMLLVRRKELPNYSPNNPKFRIFLDVWSRLPLPVTRALGPFFLRLVP